MINFHIFLICMTLWSIRGEDVDPNKCPGPLAFYKAIGCKRVGNEVCAEEYNCDEVKSLPFNKCYVNSKSYDVGERLKEEDANPCDINCTCQATEDGVPKFNCEIVDCFHGKVNPGCYRKNSPFDCCPGEEVCPEKPEDRAECIVNGKSYLDGEHFTVESDPDLNCVCQPGYEGEKVDDTEKPHKSCTP